MTVELVGATKLYDGRTVLDDVSIGFGPGLTAVTGPAGAGKSTLLRCAAGVVPLDAGTATVDGRAALLALAIVLDGHLAPVERFPVIDPDDVDVVFADDLDFALGDVTVSRLGDLLVALSEVHAVIVATHNREIIGRADRRVGVWRGRVVSDDAR